MAMIWIYPVPQSSLIIAALQNELKQQAISVNSVQRLFQQVRLSQEITLQIVACFPHLSSHFL